MSSIFCHSNNELDLSFFKKISTEIGFEFTQCKTIDDLCAKILSEPNSIIVVDTNTEEQFRKFDSALSQKIGLYNPVLHSNLMFFICDKDLYDSVYHLDSEVFGVFLPRRFNDENVHTIAQLIISDLKNKDYTINRFLSSDAKIQKFQIKKSIEKQGIVDSIRDHLIQLGFKIRAAATISVSVDELIMNAVFDAPVDETGQYIYLKTPRNKLIEMTPDKYVDFSIGFDGINLAINVTDHYGSLEKRKLINHIGKSYQNEEYKIKTSVSGAGIGLSNVYRNCCGLIFECDSSVFTSVTILYKKQPPLKTLRINFDFYPRITITQQSNHHEEIHISINLTQTNSNA